MSGHVTFHANQLQTIVRELDEERAERRRQASMNEMLMEDLRLRSWEESESRSCSTGLIRGRRRTAPELLNLAGQPGCDRP